MAEANDEEKTEDATPQKRLDFRKRGQVAQTKELGTALTLVSSVLAMWFLGRFFFSELNELFQVLLGNQVFMSVRDGGINASILFAIKKTLLLVLPIGIFLWIMSVVSSVAQVGFLINEEAMKFNLQKINPISGLKRLFSLKSLFEGGKSILKLIAIGVLCYLIINSELEKIPRLIAFDLSEIISFLLTTIFKLFGGIGLFMFMLAAIDYMYQRWDMEQQMKMSKQEIKEEHKSREGDPLIRARIRKAQREMAQKRMMADVPTADVIVTNPTHIAVALKYSDKMVAPTIVAMGADFIAEKIKSVARENNIPIIENKPLARTMYKTLEIGKMIPKELYSAVAEVLSYVYKLKGKRRKN